MESSSINLKNYSPSSSLFNQIRNYNDEGKTTPVLLLHLNNLGGQKFLALCQFDASKLQEISHSLVGGLQVGGAVTFSESKNTKQVEEINSTLVKEFGQADYQVFRYHEDDEELFRCTGGAETQVEEDSLSDSHQNVEFLAACLKFRIPTPGLTRAFDKINLFTKANGYFNISVNATQENPHPDYYLVDKESFTISNTPLPNYGKYAKDEKLPNPTIEADLLPKQLNLNYIPLNFAKTLIDLEFSGDDHPNTFDNTQKSDIDYFRLEFGVFFSKEENLSEKELLKRLMTEGRKLVRLLQANDNFGQDGVRIITGDSSFWYDLGTGLVNIWLTTDFSNPLATNLDRKSLNSLNLHGEMGCEGWRAVGLAGLKENENSEVGPVLAVKGEFGYFRYTDGGFDDKGWGCAYRSLQTLYSWFAMHGYTTRDVPTIPEI